jgi:hypothetical protein
MNRERFVLLCIISLEFFSIYVCNYHRYRRLLSIFPIFPLFSHEIIEKTILFCFTRKRSILILSFFRFREFVL